MINNYTKTTKKIICVISTFHIGVWKPESLFMFNNHGIHHVNMSLILISTGIKKIMVIRGFGFLNIREFFLFVFNQDMIWILVITMNTQLSHVYYLLTNVCKYYATKLKTLMHDALKHDSITLYIYFCWWIYAFHNQVV